MTTLEKLNSLVGKEYHATDYHCYTFIQDVLPVPNLFNVHVDTAKNDIEKYKYLFEKIEEPIDFCIVLLGDKHIGIWYNGGIYHNDHGGVRYETKRVMKLKYRSFTFYKTKDLS